MASKSGVIHLGTPAAAKPVGRKPSWPDFVRAWKFKAPHLFTLENRDESMKVLKEEYDRVYFLDGTVK